MRIGILGTGVVGATLGSALVSRGHDVTMGARMRGGERARAWVASSGPGAAEGTFAEAAAFAELALNCTAGAHSLAALEPATEGLRGKVLIDVANPLDFSRGMPPRLTVCNDDSLGEQIQRAHPDAFVVKALNTMNCSVMVEPGRVAGVHHAFVAGDDADAKERVRSLLGELGWPAEQVIDVGGIAAARGLEMYLPLWVSLYGRLGTAAFNIAVVS